MNTDIHRCVILGEQLNAFGSDSGESDLEG